MRRRSEEGFATIVGAAVVAALAVLLIAVVYLGAAVLARHRAQSAADLSALAAAASHVSGESDACAAAERIVARQDGRARIAACTVDGIDVVVRVTVRVRLGGFGVHDATAAARAGPVPS